MSDKHWTESWQAKVGAGMLVAGAFLLKRMRGATVYAKIPSEMLDYKIGVVTGGNSGLGRMTANDFGCMRMKAIVTARDIETACITAEAIRKSSEHFNVIGMECDMSSFESIHKFVDDIEEHYGRIDYLVNNAAVCMSPYTQTKDGLEMQMGVNYFGHFLLTNLLLRRGLIPPNGRIVIVSSLDAQYGKINFNNLNSELYYDNREVYYNSKLALNLFAKELSKREYARVYCVQPHLSRTNLGRHIEFPLWEKTGLFLFSRSAHVGCQTAVHCCMAEGEHYTTGGYYSNCMQVKWPQWMEPHYGDAAKLWEVAEKITGLDQVPDQRGGSHEIFAKLEPKLRHKLPSPLAF